MPMRKYVNGVLVDLNSTEVSIRLAEEAACLSGETERVKESVRNQRNHLLSATDWMALSDVTMTPEWASYRQALRDITAQEGFPYSVIWPTKPE